MQTRLIEGPRCVGCGEPVGMIQVNTRSVLVEPTGLIVGDVLIFERHRCSVKAEAEAEGRGPGGATKARGRARR